MSFEHFKKSYEEGNGKWPWYEVPFGDVQSRRGVEDEWNLNRSCLKMILRYSDNFD